MHLCIQYGFKAAILFTQSSVFLQPMGGNTHVEFKVLSAVKTIETQLHHAL